MKQPLFFISVSRVQPHLKALMNMFIIVISLICGQISFAEAPVPPQEKVTAAAETPVSPQEKATAVTETQQSLNEIQSETKSDGATSAQEDKAPFADLGEKKPFDQPQGPSLMQEGVKTVVILTLLLVIFWWLSNWLRKSGKLARIAGNQGNIECVSVYSVGQKEKIALFKIRGEEILVGITQHSIQTLHHFPREGTGAAVKNKDAQSEAEFAKALDSAEKQVSSSE